MQEHAKAISFFKKALQIHETSSSDSSMLAATYRSIAAEYHSVGDKSNALIFYEKTPQTQEKFLPADDIWLATVSTQIGSIYFPNGNYTTA